MPLCIVAEIKACGTYPSSVLSDDRPTWIQVTSDPSKTNWNTWASVPNDAA